MTLFNIQHESKYSYDSFKYGNFFSKTKKSKKIFNNTHLPRTAVKSVFCDSEKNIIEETKVKSTNTTNILI